MGGLRRNAWAFLGQYGVSLLAMLVAQVRAGSAGCVCVGGLCVAVELALWGWYAPTVCVCLLPSRPAGQSNIRVLRASFPVPASPMHPAVHRPGERAFSCAERRAACGPAWGLCMPWTFSAILCCNLIGTPCTHSACSASCPLPAAAWLPDHESQDCSDRGFHRDAHHGADLLGLL